MTEALNPALSPSLPGGIPAPPMASGWHPVHNSLRTIIIVALMCAGGIAAILAAWELPPFDSAIQRTDNAYVRGQTTIISPQVSGYVWRVAVQDYDQVQAGQALVKIDDRQYRQKVDQARAAVDAANANFANSVQNLASRQAAQTSAEATVSNAAAQLLRAEADQRRAADLVSDGSISVREADQTIASLRAAEAMVKQAVAGRDVAAQDIRTVQVNKSSLRAAVEAAQAALRSAEIDLSNTVIRAPDQGQISDVGVRVGQYVTNGTQFFFLVPPRLWVIANFKEAQTARILPGQTAWFSVDALDGARIDGRVERIAPAAGSEFAVLKPDNATGNFTKVAQRISVRIFVDLHQANATRLRPGMSVEAHIDTKSVPRSR